MSNRRKVRSDRALARAKRLRNRRIAFFGVLIAILAAILVAVIRPWDNTAPSIDATPTTEQNVRATLVVETDQPVAVEPTISSSKSEAEVYPESVDLSAITDLTVGSTPFVEIENGLIYQDVLVGTGAEAETGDMVSVNYTGWLLDGKMFDASAFLDGPFDFPLGKGHVIQGWDEGVVGMKLGGKRILIIPSDLGYGDQGAGNAIPGGSTLVFEVSLVDIPKVEIEELVEGTGPAAKSGDEVTVHYTGTFEDGRVFDSSYDRGEPIEFLLGSGQVIQGWELGLQGLKVGGQRRLIIPPSLGYGSTGSGSGRIPPKTTLYFDIELVAVNGVEQ